MGSSRSCFASLLITMIIPFDFCNSTDTLTSAHFISDAKGEALLSSQEIFKLGFFSPPNSSFRYVGIWFDKVPEQTVVWVANRDTPLENRNGIFKITGDGNIAVLSGENESFPLWSSNISMPGSVNSTARLLSSGNLVLTNGSHQVVWQSFDYPTDTGLPDMKFGLDRKSGLNRFLTSWKSDSDPARGEFSIGFDPHVLPQIFLYKGSAPSYRIGPWNGRNLNTPDFSSLTALLNYKYIDDKDEVYIIFPMSNASVLSRIFLEPFGTLRGQIWLNESKEWSSIFTVPGEQCDTFSHCGPYAICNPRTTELCLCLPGFEPEDPGYWLSKCVEKRKVNGCGKGKGEGFVTLPNLKLPDAKTAKLFENMSLPECKIECLKNCNCAAFASANIQAGGRGCFAWFGELNDIRGYSMAGQDFYLRVDAVELAANSKKSIQGLKGKKMMLLIIIPSVALVMLIILSGYTWRKKVKGTGIRKKQRSQDKLLAGSNVDFSSAEFEEDARNSELAVFDLDVVKAATDDFSPSKLLGQGGFGPVYRGQLPNGQEVAVKRLSKNSGQGATEFKNEAMLIAKLQHRNLVKLLGCCAENEEKILIYEYMPNKSLDYFIFDENRKPLLDWRKRHEIILGIARGILYLHQDSRLRIIHRDLKASNILLDEEYNPKISDFGTARVFGGNQNEANTNRVVGTYGYMSPEYALCGHFSVKSDVFSFGVILIELITGKKKLGSFHDDSCPNLITQAWQLWNEGKALEIVDSTIADSCPSEEILRCIQVGLLCVQDNATDRPDMSSIVFMLSNEVPIPKPKQPIFTIEKAEAINEAGISSGNETTITTIEAR